MELATLRQWLRQTGLNAPEGIEPYVRAIVLPDEATLLPHDDLQAVLEGNSVPAARQEALWEALAAIEGNETLLRVSQALRYDAVRALVRGTACEFETPAPACLTGFARQVYAFLYALSCVPAGRALLRARGVPPEYDRDIPERMIRKQLQKYKDTGDISFDDYPWDMNFYCCAIFFLDRFYFIPFVFGTPTAYRSRATGRVVALWPGDARVRRDGQLDGVNGVTDPEAILTVWRETDASVTANPVDPIGVIGLEPVTLDKREWSVALQEGDYTLALHIPGGEGYTPERVRSSMQKALAFYARYFPELPIKGFWSESWLYDPGLKRLLPPTSRIVRVQEQFYNYPTAEGEEMIKLEVFDDKDPAAAASPSSLQRALVGAWAEGTRFHTTGMFVLTGEVADVGNDPYLRGRGERV